MQDILNRIEKLENQVNNITITLTEITHHISENERQNVEGFKQLANVVEVLSTQLDNFFTTDRKE